MGKRIVIALGGNALGKNLHEQMDAVHVTANAIADLIQDGQDVYKRQLFVPFTLPQRLMHETAFHSFATA